MRNILEIYKEYKIMPNLQEHQLRVTGVVMQLCDSLDLAFDKDFVIKACLIHDMGNIIKFKLGYFPEFLEPEGLEYWTNVQNEYIQKYGTNEHEATLDIARELNMNEDTIKNIDAIGFSNWCHVKEDGNWTQKICTYADIRVAPAGVVSLEERIEDGFKRYAGTHVELEPHRLALYDCMREIEKEIFIHSNIKPEDITGESIIKNVEDLKSFDL